MSAARKETAPASVIALPRRRNYVPDRQPPPIEALPFVKGRGNNRQLWSVPKGLGFCQAHKLGHEFAGHFLQMIRDNGENTDWLLFALLNDMLPTTKENHQVAWAFVSVLSDVLIAATRHVDWYDIIEANNARIDRLVDDADTAMAVLRQRRARKEA